MTSQLDAAHSLSLDAESGARWFGAMGLRIECMVFENFGGAGCIIID